MTEPKKKKKKRTHPWGVWNPGSLESRNKDLPFREPLPTGTTKQNRYQ